jgi:hypothetical protein
MGLPLPDGFIDLQCRECRFVGVIDADDLALFGFDCLTCPKCGAPDPIMEAKAA